MQVTLLSDKDGICSYTISGSVTQQKLRKFDDPLEAGGAEAYGKKNLFDMSGTEFLDSSGISWLLVCHKRCREAGGQLVMHSLPKMVNNVLMVLRMNLVFDIAENEKAALALSPKEEEA